MMRSSNPTMNPAMFERERSYGINDAMTIQGTINKCFILFGLLMLTASWIWGKAMQPVAVFPGETTQMVSGLASVKLYVYGGGIIFAASKI